uniref:Cell adhesion molecule 1-like n=1 Tax=Crassostrea virginica TaxID=6565 RepID=A0A8B8AFY7_CRAVI|nr:cell adhesion molecule 1-like [Crassostrea virginica]
MDVLFNTGITLSVVPSSNVEVGQIVTIQCELDKTPNSTLVMFFEVQSPSNVSTVCILVMTNSECRTYDDCVPFYNTFCRNSTLFSTQLNISKNWIGASVFCRTFNETSNSVVLMAEVPVSSITLLPTVISVIAGQQMNLTCETSYCNPPANITWYKSLNDITNQSTSKTYIVDGLTKTVSVLLSPVVKADNRNQIYCIANNTRNTEVSSSIRTLDVTYKPEIKPILSSLYSVIEGETATILCEVTDANPNTSITWRWFKTDRPNIVLYNGPNYTIPNIQRVGSGSYSCTANNTVGTSEPATIQVDVQSYIRRRVEWGVDCKEEERN